MPVIITEIIDFYVHVFWTRFQCMIYYQVIVSLTVIKYNCNGFLKDIISFSTAIFPPMHVTTTQIIDKTTKCVTVIH